MEETNDLDAPFAGARVETILSVIWCIPSAWMPPSRGHELKRQKRNNRTGQPGMLPSRGHELKQRFPRPSPHRGHRCPFAGARVETVLSSASARMYSRCPLRGARIETGHGRRSGCGDRDTILTERGKELLFSQQLFSSALGLCRRYGEETAPALLAELDHDKAAGSGTFCVRRTAAAAWNGRKQQHPVIA